MKKKNKRNNNRKFFFGTIIKKSGNKTVKIYIENKILHKKYKKAIKRKTILYAHDKNNICKIGEKVNVMSTRPISKNKFFVVVK